MKQKQPGNEAPRGKPRGIAKLRRSQPAFALTSYGAIHLAIHPRSKQRGILAKANEKQCTRCISFYKGLTNALALSVVFWSTVSVFFYWLA